MSQDLKYISVKLSSAAGGATIQLDRAKLPEDSKEFLLEYGATQWLNDAHAPITAAAYPDATIRATKKREAVDARVAKAYAGQCRTRDSGTVTPAAIAKSLGVSVEAVMEWMTKTQAAAAKKVA